MDFRALLPLWPGGIHFGDLALEIATFSEEFAVLIVAVRLEAGHELVLLHIIQTDGFRLHGPALQTGDVILDRLHAAHMIAGFRQQADAVLEINRGRPFQRAPQRHPPRGGRPGLVGQQ